MTNLSGLALHISNFKSFGSDGSGLSEVKPINIVIGRNNSGKSALLDAIGYLRDWAQIPESLFFGGKQPILRFSKLLRENEVELAFKKGSSGGDIGGNHWADVGQYLVGSRISVRQTATDKKFVSIEPGAPERFDERALLKYYQGLTNQLKNPIEEKIFARLAADRDIKPEPEQVSLLEPLPNGDRFTSAVAFIATRIEQPSELVEKLMLNRLNAIFYPDANFTAIRIRRHANGNWEILLEEEGKGSIALSHSGSGLKTILLVVGYSIILPFFHKRPLADFVFALEELENNLHPAMQRRLMKFVRDLAVEDGCTVFVTTHSSAVIDIFSRDPVAQILHVVHKDGVSKVGQPVTYIEHHGILDDLDIRASDLLQANGIVWLEGPSDRLYFNRWIALWTNDEIKEGVHYQCVFYGGRLLAHLSADDPELDAADVVKILRVNRNAIVITDSDKRDANAAINSTKVRIAQEMSAIGGIAWISAGREVENYLPQEALQAVYPDLAASLGQFEDIYDYLDRAKSGEGERFKRQKVLYAEKFASFLTRKNLNNQLDLNMQMDAVVSKILGWNGARESQTLIGS